MYRLLAARGLKLKLKPRRGSSRSRRLSAPGLGSAWRGLMTAQADHGQICSASRGTRPVSSGRDMVHLARGSRLADDDAARLERPIRRRLTPTRRRAEETGSWAGWASRLSRSRAAVPSCVCENLILFCPIELEVLLKFLENSKILYSYNYINLASDRPRMRRMHERMPSSKSLRRLRPCHRCDARARACGVASERGGRARLWRGRLCVGILWWRVNN